MAENDLKRICVRSWRKRTREREDWKLILKGPRSCMELRATGEIKRQRIHSLHFLSGYFQCKDYYTLYSVTCSTS
jgi:hypothetical protein